MSQFLKTMHDGEVMIDHSASPGLDAATAQRMGLPPELVAGGRRVHAPTLGCPHCGSCVVLNPMRQRERANCFQCNMYICDFCDAARHEPDYVHRTFKQVADMVTSGKYILGEATTAHRPVLIKIGD